MSPSDIQLLYDYNGWANRRSLAAAEKLPAEQFTRPMGSSFSSVRDTLAHIYGAEWLWLERFQGRSPSSLPNAAEFQDLGSLRIAGWSTREDCSRSCAGCRNQTWISRWSTRL